jgi:hypothetical protein
MVKSVLVVAALVGGACLFGCNDTLSGGGGGGGGDGGASSSSGGSSSSSGGGNPNAVTIGPDVTNPTGTANTFGCGAGYPIQTNPQFPQPFYAAGSPSCLVLTFLAPIAGQPTSLKSGTALSATIAVGSVTGPMRFVRMRILFNRKDKQQCCSLEQYGDEFTPKANGTTTVSLSFPMTIEPLPPENDTTTTIANDLIALEVLSPDVPIPGHWPNNGGPVDGTASYMWLPALSTKGQQAPSNQLLVYTGSYTGFVPSFNISYVQN